MCPGIIAESLIRFCCFLVDWKLNLMDFPCRRRSKMGEKFHCFNMTHRERAHFSIMQIGNLFRILNFSGWKVFFLCWVHSQWSFSLLMSMIMMLRNFLIFLSTHHHDDELDDSINIFFTNCSQLEFQLSSLSLSARRVYLETVFGPADPPHHEHNRRKVGNFFPLFLMKVKSFRYFFIFWDAEGTRSAEVEAPFSAFSLHHFTTIIPARSPATTTWKRAKKDSFFFTS